MNPRAALRALLRALPRSMRKRLYARFLPRLARGGPIALRCGRGRFLVELDFSDPAGAETARRLFLDGCLERPVEEYFGSLLAPGMIVLDVGANWGYYALLAARALGTEGRVIAFEPEPTGLARLRRNLELNPGARVEVEPVAIADCAGELEFHLGRTSGTGTLLAAAPHAGKATLSVKTVALDAYMDAHGLARADLVKMDIEGAEVMALEGMAAGLASGRYGHLVIEWHGTSHASLGERPREALALLERAGYALYRLGRRHERRALTPVAAAEVARARVHLWARPPDAHGAGKG